MTPYRDDGSHRYTQPHVLIHTWIACDVQGLQPNFSSTPVLQLDYASTKTGGLIAIAGQDNNFAISFSGTGVDDEIEMFARASLLAV